LGLGYSVEEQITGKPEHGGLQSSAGAAPAGLATRGD